ncbi:minor capsid protein [Metabacillus bambusae]|uniref:Minor capsid protein n=1 Tax=Metabacillus bambusae TaxID=2795218 RepID=A0ABS3NC99_9BACI|nr:minor capsid protein [Metabacillus bambusae]MBO1515604.1 minor capsid protein [Metabacillus bambusae]
MDIVAQITTYLKNNANLNGLPVVSPLLGSGNSIAIRETPSSVESRYLNADKTINFQFQILVKHDGAMQVRNIINDIFNILDGLSQGVITSANGSFFMSSCECTTLPNFVEQTDQDFYVYTAIFNAELELGGN